jgi:hypothetical protein
MSEQCVILNDIHIDIMDYIKPAHCTEAQVCTKATDGRVLYVKADELVR